jgi:hypothetical protein
MKICIIGQFAFIKINMLDMSKQLLNWDNPGITNSRSISPVSAYIADGDTIVENGPATVTLGGNVA